MLNPVASHALARAAYKSGVPMWPGAVTDQVRQRGGRSQPAAPAAIRARPATGAAPVTGFWALDYLLVALLLASAVLVRADCVT